MGAHLFFVFKRLIGIAGTIFSILSFVLSIWSWDELGVSGYDKVYILIAIVFFSFFAAVIWTIVSKRKKKWQQGNASIEILYGDVIKIGFTKKRLKYGKRIVVIPVNTHFDTIVNDEIVASSTIHGQWINHLCENDETAFSISNKIQAQIRSQNVDESHVDLSKKGNQTAYPLGTVVKYDYGNTIFYLIAISEYDTDLKAHCSKEQFHFVVKSLIDFYDTFGQGYPIYIPLFGTELSRVGISESESMQIIVDLCMLYREKIHGKVNIVVYEKHRSQVPIFE